MMQIPAGALRRLWTNYVTTAANTNEQKFTFTTQDDYRDRYVDTIFVGLATAGISLALYSGGQEYSVIDLSRFAAGDQILKVQFKLDARIQMIYSFTDLAGGAHTNIPVVLGYYPDPSQGR